MSHSFSPHFVLNEEDAVNAVLKDLSWSAETSKKVEKRAAEFVNSVRAQKQAPGQLETFLRDYALDTEEGVALMTLAEALLRVPDKDTARALIHDKVVAANWLESAGGSRDWVVKAAGVGLFMTSKTLGSALRKIGEPFVREAMIKAMRILGQQFVLGRDIEEAFQNSQKSTALGYRMSYDILGEGARTAVDAERYFESYADAIDYVGMRGVPDGQRPPGISVKLSALHPRYEFAQKERCVPEMAALLLELAKKAASHNVALTVDAEESERLNISIEIVEQVMSDPALKGWDGFGLAVQAYHKATLSVIDHIVDCAKSNGQQVQMRLVKGAYWDSEIKKAQVDGLENFPVYTRKSHTDAAYIACVSKMLSHTDVLYPMFATHNAHSIAAVIELGKELNASYEFQRLFGMGDALFKLALEQDIPASIYAPVGPHEDLLPYLVRRLLENGANSSFVNQILDPDAPVDKLVSDPVEKIKNRNEYKHPKIDLPKDIFQTGDGLARINSSGMDLNDPDILKGVYDASSKFKTPYKAMPLVGGYASPDGASDNIYNPGDKDDYVGQVFNATQHDVSAAFDVAQDAFSEWSGLDANIRAQIFEKAADALESRSMEYMSLLVREAGKTIPDALGEIREAVDFMRYYAVQGRAHFSVDGEDLPGPTGESNRLILQGRGVFVCISPWNFPLAIFAGQVVAALMAGNTVIAKPAEQTPLIAMLLVRLLHDAGVPVSALNLLPGDGQIGADIIRHVQVAGVAFTGSTDVAHEINRSLAAKNGAIVPLIAETGGQNVMVVDSSALPEQVIDDVILSAFGSAGQRCSALRVLCVQDDIADKLIRMLKGAMQEMVVGDPAYISSDVGPVIDDEAYAMLARHRESLKGFGQFVCEIPMSPVLQNRGFYFGPCAYELVDLKGLAGEVFGPVLHIVRYKKDELDDLLEQIKDTGYGLTLGIHSRIQGFHDYIKARVPAGNVYVNRSMIGAVVGSQPFGGMGLSGTGPKAGGPHYLQRFATERVVSVDTTAAGGNASLVSLSE